MQSGMKTLGWASENSELEEGLPVDSLKEFSRVQHKGVIRGNKHSMLSDSDDDDSSDDDTDDSSDDSDDDTANSTLVDGNETSSNSSTSNNSSNATGSEEEVKDEQDEYAHYQDACNPEKDPLDLTMNCWLRYVASMQVTREIVLPMHLSLAGLVWPAGSRVALLPLWPGKSNKT